MKIDHDEFARDVGPGLSQPLPPGEAVLWQGRPDAGALTRALGVRWVLGYFAVVVAWRFIAAADAGAVAGIAHALPYVALGAAAFAVIRAMAWVMARATIYTVTTGRVVMRIGAVLPLTVNLPYSQIANAALAAGPRGTGTIALEPMADAPRLSWWVLWPHNRPGHLRQPQPALRCIPDAARVAEMLAESADARAAVPTLARAPIAAE